MTPDRRTERLLRHVESLAAPPRLAGEAAAHALAVACAAERLTLQMVEVYGADAGVDPAEAFQCGLWHDLGKLALAAAFPKAFARAAEAAALVGGASADAERRVIGVDHLLAGKRAAERWGLAESIRDCAWLHGQHPAMLPAGVANARLVNLVTLADQLARGSDACSVPRAALVDALGLSDLHVSRAAEGLAAAVSGRAGEVFLCEAASGSNPAACGFAKKSSLETLDFHAALTRFQHAQCPNGSASDLLLSIATSAAVALGKTAAAVSLPPGREYGETAVADAAGGRLHEGVVDAGAWPVDLPGETLVRPAGDGLEWILSDVGPALQSPSAHRLAAPLAGRVSPSSRPASGAAKRGAEEALWICLVAEGRPVGAVVWNATDADLDRLNHDSTALAALAAGWALALRARQARDEARHLSEQLAESNRRLLAAQDEVLRHRAQAAVGEVAAGAAHEMNNPLMVISGRGQLLAASLTDEKQKSAAKQIVEQSQRLSDMISSLMEYARPRPPSIASVDLRGLVGRALALAKRQTDPADRTVVVNVPPDLPPALADADQLAEAVGEVLANAYQATAADGRVEVLARFDAYSQRVVLTVSDDGCGMDAATLGHCCDPFFSAKPAGRRRGMGLSVALRKVEAGGGTLRLDSEPGRGARATFLLPAADVAVEAIERRKSA